MNDSTIITDSVKRFKWVGTRPIRPDGVPKVTGRALYGADLKLPGITRLREILHLCESKNLVRLQPTADFADTTIQVLPTIRHVIPFPSIEEWQRTRDRHVQAAATELTGESPTEDEVS